MDLSYRHGRTPRALLAAVGILGGTAIRSAWADDAPDAATVKPVQDIVITAQRLVDTRNDIETKIGATVYRLTDEAIQNLPGAYDLPLNQILLQAPGVSQDSYGQIHLRNDHANIQYRIDGVILPEGISFFGQSLPTRIAESVDLITGSLPSQYGLVTTGIVDIQTKSGAFKPGGSVGVYGGSNDWLEPSVEYAGSTGNFNYFVSGDYLRDGIGIENPTDSSRPLHDTTQQGHGFALLEDTLDSSSRILAILGYYQGSFQIPDSPGQPPAFQYLDQTDFDSTKLNEHQLESNDYGVLSYLHSGDRFDFQVSAFVRYSRLAYTPDSVGDLMFYGLTQTAVRTDVAEGLQEDSTYRLTPDHTLRFGALVTTEHAMAKSISEVFPCLDDACDAVGTSPVTVGDGGTKTGYTYSVYGQDEWKLTPTLTFNYGLRFDVLNAYTNTSQISPRANLVWKPDGDTAFHAGYSRYFTPPAMELISGESIAKFANTTGYPGGYTPSSPPLDGPILPERSNYFDIGASHVIAKGLKVGVDAYAKIAQDLIDEGQFGSPIILSVFNYGHANVFGVEFTANYDLGDWSAYSNFAVGRERATHLVSQQFNFSPDDIAFIANNYIYTDHNQWYTASGGVSYNWSGTHLNADVVYGSGLREDAGDIPNGGTVTPYAQINLGIVHRFDDTPAGPIEWGLNVINVTDRDYLIRSGSGVGVFAPQYGARRAFYSSLKVFF